MINRIPSYIKAEIKGYSGSDIDIVQAGCLGRRKYGYTGWNGRYND